VDYSLLKIDLSSQQAVRAAAEEVLSGSDVPTVDIIVNSAGVMCLLERTLNEDGLEMHFATNHIGHLLFTCLLMPKLLKAAENNPTKGVVNISPRSPT
jgi:NAD(P)-dependent dehydrogenase (short-subunit alcohol dehydrogenase family)